MTESLPFGRPAADEHPPYYSTYIDKVPDGDLLGILADQVPAVLTTLRPVGEAGADHAYGPGKWTIKEVVGHLADTERVMAYRALTFARGDSTALPSFDENTWAPAGRFGERTLASLLDEWVAVRSASIALLAGLPADTGARSGTASGKPISVRALAYIIAGHLNHHLGILEARYL